MASKCVEDLISHEMAHFMCFQDCKTYGDFLQRETELRKLFVRGVSGYADATMDGAETIAEAFVRMKNGEKVSEVVKMLVEKYVERWRK